MALITPLRTDGVKNDIVLQLPYSTIQFVKFTQYKMNYQINLKTDTGTIYL